MIVHTRPNEVGKKDGAFVIVYHHQQTRGEEERKEWKKHDRASEAEFSIVEREQRKASG